MDTKKVSPSAEMKIPRFSVTAFQPARMLFSILCFFLLFCGGTGRTRSEMKNPETEKRHISSPQTIRSFLNMVHRTGALPAPMIAAMKVNIPT